MSPLSMPPSKRRPADQRPQSARKKRKIASVALEHAFVYDDTRYCPPYSLRGASPPARLALQKQLQRPKNPNGCDPFQHLGDDVVHLVISILTPKDTEIMRRVSKFWKATSEYHCGKATMIQHLPWAASQDFENLSKEDINLQYRRQLYNYSSLVLGMATRAFKFTGVYDWHLNGKAIAWTNGCDKAFIRVLKTSDGTPIASQDELADFRHQPSTEIPYVQLTKSGDLIVLHRSYIDTTELGTVDDLHPSLHRCPQAEDVLIKLTKAGEAWRLLLQGVICKPAVGKDAIYFVELPKGPLYSEHGPAFKKVDLATGTVMYAHPLPQIHETGVFVRPDQGDDTIAPGYVKVHMPTRGRKIEIAKLDITLKLAGNETIAVWSDLNFRIHVFSTVNGQILYTYNRDYPSSLAVSAIKPQIWDITARIQIPGIDLLRLSTYDPRTEAVTYAFAPSTWCARPQAWRAHSDAPAYIDADRPVAFNLCHSILAFLPPETRDPFTTIEIAGLNKEIDGEKIRLGDVVRPKKAVEDEEDKTLITLPPLPGKDTGRRLLEFEATWVPGKDDFFGIVEGYLVYHNFPDKELIVIDFWPTW